VKYTSSHIWQVLFSLIFLLAGPTAYCQVKTIKVKELPVVKYALDNKISYGTPSGIMEDSYGYIWVARERGLMRFDGYNFKLYSSELPNPRCNRIHEDDMGDLWIPTDFGFARYLRSTDNFEIFNPLSDLSLLLKSVPMDTLPQEVLYGFNRIANVRPLNDSMVLLASANGVHYYNIKQKLLDSTVFMIPSRAGLFSFSHTTYTFSPTAKNSKDSIWVGTRGGFGLLTPSTYKIEPVLEKLTGTDARVIKLPETNQFLYTEIKDQGDRLLMGSWGNGLVSFDKESGYFQWNRYIRANSQCRLCENISFGLTYLNRDLILSGGTGRDETHEKYPIKLYNLKTQTLTFFNSDEIHPNKLADSYAYGTCIDRNGKIWINQYTAVCKSIDSFAQPIATVNPHLAISHIKVNNKPKEFNRNLEQTVNIEFNSDDENLEIGFYLINPKDPKKTHYAYKLEGHDKNWIETRTNRSARYERLKKGSYIFSVRTEENGRTIERKLLNINQNRAILSNDMIRFISIGLLTLLTLLALFQRSVRLNQRDKMRSKFDRDLAELEIQGIRSQLNPHFLFNSLNSIKHFIQLGDNKTAALYLSKFSSLMRNTLNHSRSDLITLEEELKSLKLFLELEKMRFEDKFEFEINIDPSLKLEEIQIPPMVLQPFAENAIWHGLLHKSTPGLLYINVQLSTDTLEVTILDDGIGRARAAELKSKSAERHKIEGLKVTQNRMDLLSKLYKEKTSIRIQDLFSKDKIAEGTRVTLNFPLQQTTLYESHIN